MRCTGRTSWTRWSRRWPTSPPTGSSITSCWTARPRQPPSPDCTIRCPPVVVVGYASAANYAVAMRPGRKEGQRVEALARGLTDPLRSEEHTSELQSRGHLVCRLLLEKKITPLHNILTYV